MDVYARVENGVIVEYPVYPVHIQTRAHPFDWYTKCTFDDKPAFGEFQDCREVPEIQKDGSVVVHYVVSDLSLEILMNRLPFDANDPANIGLPGADNPPPTPELVARIQKLTIARVQKRLDDFAATRGYGDDQTSAIVSACSYATDTDPRYGAEGRYCVVARRDTWNALYAFNAEVAAGTRPMPRTYAEIEAVLPSLEWPA